MSLRNTKIFNVTRAEKVGRIDEFKEEGGLVSSQGGPCRSSSMRLLTFKWNKEPLQGEATPLYHPGCTESQNPAGHSQPGHHHLSGITSHWSSILLRTVDGLSFWVPFKTSKLWVPPAFRLLSRKYSSDLSVKANHLFYECVSIVSIQSSFEPLVAWLLEIVIPFQVHLKFLALSIITYTFTTHVFTDCLLTCVFSLFIRVSEMPLPRATSPQIMSSPS